MNFQSNPRTRIQKFARYRKAILKMKGPSSLNPKFLATDSDIESFKPKPITLFMWVFGGGVIILLILVVALVYFVR
jgi:hypothetical protein